MMAVSEIQALPKAQQCSLKQAPDSLVPHVPSAAGFAAHMGLRAPAQPVNTSGDWVTILVLGDI